MPFLLQKCTQVKVKSILQKRYFKKKFQKITQVNVTCCYPSLPTTGRKRKRDRDDEPLDLIRQGMRQQREPEESRAHGSMERMDRLFSLLERLVPKSIML